MGKKFRLECKFKPSIGFYGTGLRLSLILFTFFQISYQIDDEKRDGALVWLENVENEETVEKTKAYFAKNPIGSKTGDVFQATNEWQEIKPGQKVPAGLHYRMDMETGKKEAKLLETNDDTTERDSLNDRKILLMREMKKALRELEKQEEMEKEMKETISEEEAAEKFRSYEDLKKDFQAINANIQTDLEIIKQLMKEYRMKNCSLVRKLQILQEFESFVHQIDNAQNFVTSEDIDGISVIKEALNNSEDEFREKGALILGAAAQSNPKVQVAVLENGLLHLLINLLTVEKRIPVCQKLIFATSSVLRRFPYAQTKFYELRGFETLIKLLLAGSDQKISTKILTLLTDLLEEKREIEILAMENAPKNDVLQKWRQYQNVELADILIDHEICKLSSDLLSLDENYDFQERILRAIQAMRTARACTHEHIRLMAPNLHNLKTHYEIQLVQEPDDDYLMSLLDICTKLIQPLPRSRDEL